MFKLSYTFCLNSRVCSRTISTIFNKTKEFSTVSLPESNQSKISQDNDKSLKTHSHEKYSEINETFKTKSKIVAAAFASLNDKSALSSSEISTPHTDLKIANATTVEQLLSISSGEGISRRLALKIVSVLADWTNTKKIKLSDFENDLRFIKLCRVLTKGNFKHERYGPSKSEDLSTVLSVTADDEAAKLVETITLPQMIKVMKTLSSKKRRSTLLLRTLAYNISGSAEKLDLKHSSDLLYSMSSLNFIDENLLSRVALDICVELELEPQIKNSAVIGSILVSLGLLKYKNPVVLDLLTDWIAKRCETCRSQDVFSLFVTLGILNYLPSDAERCFKSLSPVLTESEAGKPLIWLEHIWAKTLLNVVTAEEISHILSDEFISSVMSTGGELQLSTKLKFLNIKAAADFLIENYSGNKLKTSSQFLDIPVPKRKEKIEMTESVINSIKYLIQSDRYVRTNINTGYGFYIDAECVLDNHCRPIELNADKIDGTRIAIVTLDFHDMTRGKVEPNGINALNRRILEAQGYKVLMIPFNEFKPKDKLISRVQYLEKNFKELIKNV